MPIFLRFASFIFLALTLGSCAPRFGEIAPGQTPGLYGKLYLPDGRGPHPAVVILHGIGGMRRAYPEDGKFLASQGYAALVLAYYSPGGYWAADAEGRAKKWQRWSERAVQAVEFLRGHPAVDGDRIGLLGFSQGGALALVSASRARGLKAVVNYFGAGIDSWYIAEFMDQKDVELEKLARSLPPLLILHGGLDIIVSPRHSRELAAAVRRASAVFTGRGRTAEMYVYRHALHGFNERTYRSKHLDWVQADARARTLKFLDRHLTAGE